VAKKRGEISPQSLGISNFTWQAQEKGTNFRTQESWRAFFQFSCAKFKKILTQEEKGGKKNLKQ